MHRNAELMSIKLKSIANAYGTYYGLIKSALADTDFAMLYRVLY